MFSPVTSFYSGVEPFSKYSPVTLHLSYNTTILNENLEYAVFALTFHSICSFAGCKRQNLLKRQGTDPAVNQLDLVDFHLKMTWYIKIKLLSIELTLQVYS